jgi:hypothetical protein
VSLNKLGVGAAIVAASAAIVVGGSALANAAARSSVGAGSAGYGTLGYGAPGYGGQSGEGGPGGHGGRGPGGGGGSADTPVTGDELTKVKDAVKAKDSAVTVTSVQKDPDGSYDVYGTKAGAQVAYDVSADLKTFTARTGGRPGHGGPGGPGGGSADQQVTGDELTKVTAAVKAKDAAVTVTRVQKDPDNSYDVFGTKAGAPVMFEVSADLKTITQNTFPGRQGGRAPAAPGANA